MLFRVAIAPNFLKSEVWIIGSWWLPTKWLSINFFSESIYELVNQSVRILNRSLLRFESNALVDKLKDYYSKSQIKHMSNSNFSLNSIWTKKENVTSLSLCIYSVQNQTWNGMKFGLYIHPKLSKQLCVFELVGYMLTCSVSDDCIPLVLLNKGYVWAFYFTIRLQYVVT